jgi:hypothetical protein
MTSDGKRGIAAPYSHDENVRTSPWRATHLKTARAGLLQRLDEPTELPGPHPWDMFIMMPCIEMAGHDRSIFIPDVLYVYNESNSWEHQHPQQVPLLRSRDAEFRDLEPFKRIEVL